METILKKMKCKKRDKEVIFEYEKKIIKAMPFGDTEIKGKIIRCREKECPLRGCFYHFKGNGHEFNPFI
jgi:hypothetical protein